MNETKILTDLYKNDNPENSFLMKIENQNLSSTLENVHQSGFEETQSVENEDSLFKDTNTLAKIDASSIIDQKLSPFTSLRVEKKKEYYVNSELDYQISQVMSTYKQTSVPQSTQTIQILGSFNFYYKKNWFNKQLTIKTQGNKFSKLCMQIAQFPLEELIKAKIIFNQDGQETKEGLVKLTFQKYQNSKKQTKVLFISAKRSRQNGIITDQFKLFADIIQSKLKTTNTPLSDWNKTTHIDSNIIQNTYIYGKILKKRQIKDQWNLRYAIIKDQGFYSFHNNMDTKYSFTIWAKEIKQIWTRFDLFYDNLLFKIRHGLAKTQVALPICNFAMNQDNNWLLQFYRIANKSF